MTTFKLPPLPPTCPSIRDCVTIAKNVILYPPLARSSAKQGWCHAVTEVEKKLTTCNFSVHYSRIKPALTTPPPCPRQRGTLKSGKSGSIDNYRTLLFSVLILTHYLRLTHSAVVIFSQVFIQCDGLL